jgi:predicted glycosyltransferase
MSTFVVMYAQNGAGLGHFRRCANVAGAVVASRDDAHVVVASRSLWPAATLPLPERCDLLKLPTFAPLGEDAAGERRVLVDREGSELVSLRSSLLTTLLKELRPRTVLVDNEPRGLQGELLEPLRRARAEGFVERVVCGLRDIRGRPDYIVPKWRANGTSDALAELYDAVLVYGDRSFFDTAAAYGLGDSIPVAVRWVGHVFRDRPERSAVDVREELGIAAGAPLVAVTAGSGADGFSLLDTYLGEAAPALPAGVASVLVAGPLMPEQELAELRARTGEGRRVLRAFDTVSLVHAADAVVCRGGYNSVCEAVHAGHAPVVVPRRTASGEQETRAEAFAELGVARFLSPDAADGGALAAAVTEQLARGRNGTSPFAPTESAARAARELVG